jgi:hypothetical protein
MSFLWRALFSVLLMRNRLAEQHRAFSDWAGENFLSRRVDERGKVVTQIVTQLFATGWQWEGSRRSSSPQKKEPQAGYALGVLVDQAAGAGGLGVPPDPVLPKVFNQAPIGFNSRSRAPDLIIGFETNRRNCGHGLRQREAIGPLCVPSRLVESWRAFLHRKRYERHGTRLCAHAPNPTMHSASAANIATFTTASIMLPSTESRLHLRY